MAEQQPDKGRRCMLVAASAVAGGVATVAAGVPFAPINNLAELSQRSAFWKKR